MFTDRIFAFQDLDVAMAYNSRLHGALLLCFSTAHSQTFTNNLYTCTRVHVYRRVALHAHLSTMHIPALSFYLQNTLGTLMRIFHH